MATYFHRDDYSKNTFVTVLGSPPKLQENCYLTGLGLNTYLIGLFSV